MFTAIFAIASALIAGGISIGSAVHQKKENERNRAEAKSLADISRQDTLTKQKNINELNNSSLDLNQKQIDFSRTISNMSIANKEDQKQTMIGTANQESTKNIADSLFNPVNGRLLSKKRFV